MLSIDPATHRVRVIARLPLAPSDLGAVRTRGELLVAGGRDRLGRVHAEVWRLRPA